MLEPTDPDFIASMMAGVDQLKRPWLDKCPTCQGRTTITVYLDRSIAAATTQESCPDCQEDDDDEHHEHDMEHNESDGWEYCTECGICESDL